MIEVGNRFGFALKTLAEAGLFGVYRRQNFDGNVTVQAGLVSFVNRCHPALANLFDEELQEYSRKTMSKDEINQAFSKLLNKITLNSARAIAEPRVQELKAVLDKD